MLNCFASEVLKEAGLWKQLPPFAQWHVLQSDYSRLGKDFDMYSLISKYSNGYHYELEDEMREIESLIEEMYKVSIFDTLPWSDKNVNG